MPGPYRTSLAPRDIPAENFALEQALENRPDHPFFPAEKPGGKTRHFHRRQGNAATISVTGSASSGTGLPPDDDYSVGITLSVPVFDEGLTDYRIAEARADGRRRP